MGTPRRTSPVTVPATCEPAAAWIRTRWRPACWDCPPPFLATGSRTRLSRQHGVRVKLSSPTPRRTKPSRRSTSEAPQTGASRYDQLDGGVGNLLNRFDPQTLDFVNVRYSRVGLPGLETLSASLSVQRAARRPGVSEHQQRQAGAPVADFHRTQSDERLRLPGAGRRGGSAARIRFSAGAEFYDEYVESSRLDGPGTAPQRATSADTTAVRARYPNGARYRTLGVYCQDSFPVFSNRLTATVLSATAGSATASRPTTTRPAPRDRWCRPTPPASAT